MSAAGSEHGVDVRGRNDTDAQRCWRNVFAVWLRSLLQVSHVATSLAPIDKSLWLKEVENQGGGGVHFEVWGCTFLAFFAPRFLQLLGPCGSMCL